MPSPTSSTGPVFATLTMTNSVLNGNQAIGGNATGTGFFSEAGQAFGGAIEDSTGSSVTLAGCTFSNNQALGGAGGGFNEAFGGAIDSNSSLGLSISGSTFTGNEAVGGAGPAVAGPFAFFLSGGGADGGAIASFEDPLVLTGSTFKNNQAIGGNALIAGDNSDGGSADGGAIFYESTSASVTASVSGCTFVGNQATGGVGDGGGGGSAEAGAIESTGGLLPGVATLSITKTAIINNAAVAGSDSVGSYPAGAAGGGIVNEAGGLVLTNCIVSGNQAISAASSKTNIYGVYQAGSADGGGLVHE